MDDNPYAPPQIGEPTDPWILWLPVIPLLLGMSSLAIAVSQAGTWLPSRPWFVIAWIMSGVAALSHLLVGRIFPGAWLQRVTPYFNVATWIVLVAIGPKG